MSGKSYQCNVHVPFPACQHPKLGAGHWAGFASQGKGSGFSSVLKQVALMSETPTKERKERKGKEGRTSLPHGKAQGPPSPPGRAFPAPEAGEGRRGRRCPRGLGVGPSRRARRAARWTLTFLRGRALLPDLPAAEHPLHGLRRHSAARSVQAFSNFRGRPPRGQDVMTWAPLSGQPARSLDQ